MFLVFVPEGLSPFTFNSTRILVQNDFAEGRVQDDPLSFIPG